MTTKRKYIKRVQAEVIAVQLQLDTAGFSYHKWGGLQNCKPGDWIVNNAGDVYTVDADTFARSYRAVSAGLYLKVTPVWARIAELDGAIETKEGVTHYQAGDYLVFNDEQEQDGYAVTAALFEAIYEPGE